jgi:hypothetical protein
MAFHCFNLELIKQEKTSLYDWYGAKYGDLELKLCLENSNLAGENSPTMIFSILIRGNIIFNTEYRFISSSTIQHKLDEITHMFQTLNFYLVDLKI